MTYRKRRRPRALRTLTALLALAAVILALAKWAALTPGRPGAGTPPGTRTPTASAPISTTTSVPPASLPAHMKIIALGSQPESPVAGQPMTIQVQARNEGGQAGSFAATVTLDGAELGSVEARLAAGQTRTLTLEATAPAAGAHALALPGMRAALYTLGPADIFVTSLGSDHPYGSPHTALAAAVTLSNAGDEDGVFPLRVQLNGEDILEKEIVVPALEVVTIPLSVPLGDAGAYQLQAGGQACALYAIKLGRPANGAILVKSANRGYGRLTIGNRNAQDALVLLSSAKKPDKVLLAVYARANSDTAAIKVQDGNYLVYYTTGEDFDTASRRFIAHARSTRFDDPVKFTTTKGDSAITYSTWSIELGAGQGETQAQNVPTAELPQ